MEFQRKWIDTYLSLDEDSDVVTCFCKLGEREFSSSDLVYRALEALEIFVCYVYSLADLRWDCFDRQI